MIKCRKDDTIIYAHDAGVYLVVNSRDIFDLCSAISSHVDNVRLQYVVFGKEPHRFMLLTSMDKEKVINHLVSFFQDVQGDKTFKRENVFPARATTEDDKYANQYADVIQVDQLCSKEDNRELFDKFKHYFDDFHTKEQEKLMKKRGVPKEHWSRHMKGNDMELLSEDRTMVSLYPDAVRFRYNVAKEIAEGKLKEQGKEPVLDISVLEQLKFDILTSMIPIKVNINGDFNNNAVVMKKSPNQGSMAVGTGFTVNAKQTKKRDRTRHDVPEREQKAVKFINDNSPIGMSLLAYRSLYAGHTIEKDKLSRSALKKVMLSLGYTPSKRINKGASVWEKLA